MTHQQHREREARMTKRALENTNARNLREIIEIQERERDYERLMVEKALRRAEHDRRADA